MDAKTRSLVRVAAVGLLAVTAVASRPVPIEISTASRHEHADEAALRRMASILMANVAGNAIVKDPKALESRVAAQTNHVTIDKDGRVLSADDARVTLLAWAKQSWQPRSRDQKIRRGIKKLQDSAAAVWLSDGRLATAWSQHDCQTFSIFTSGAPTPPPEERHWIRGLGAVGELPPSPGHITKDEALKIGQVFTRSGIWGITASKTVGPRTCFKTDDDRLVKLRIHAK